MGKVCAVIGCSNREDKRRDLKFYRIPKNPERRARWIAAIRRTDWEPNNHHRLCSCHFISGKKDDNPLKPDYVPTLFSFVKKSPVKRARREVAEKFARRREMAEKIVRRKELMKKNKRLASVTQKNPVQTDGSVDSGEDARGEKSIGEDIGLVNEDAGPGVDAPVEMGTQTMRTMDYISSIEKECVMLRTENFELRRKLSECSFSESGFTHDNSTKVKNFTGLPNLAALMAIFELVKPHMTERKVSKFQQFILTLLKIKFFVNNDFLGCVFKLSSATVSLIFQENIELLYKYAVPALVFWPDKFDILKSLPACFYGQFKNCTSIIGCFELFIARPSDPQAHAQTYSQCKSHNTVKYLISVTPQGHTSFVSNGWGGGASDKYVTDHSGYLDKLEMGDIVLADRGFDIADSIALRHVTSHIPAFTRGESQLEAVDVVENQKMANVRIHVERVIGMVRQKFSVLNSVIPITMIQTDDDETTRLDKIVAIACAICNACPSIITSD